MSRKKTKINPIRAERVKTLINCLNVTQAEFGRRVPMTQQNISRIIQQKQGLSEETAHDIIKAANSIINERQAAQNGITPDEYGTHSTYRVQWLLGYDDFMTVEDLNRQYVERAVAVNSAVMTILDAAVSEVCAREGLEIPQLNNIPEYLLLKAQLRDFADSIVWNYLKHRQHSHVWALLDQVQKK